jgi:hypothetical protein
VLDQRGRGQALAADVNDVVDVDVATETFSQHTPAVRVDRAMRRRRAR